jgi:hypothetical protein
MASPALIVRVVGDTKGLSDSLKEADKGLSVFGKSVSVGGVAAMAGLAGAAVVAGKALVDMTMSAAADRDETAKLALTIAKATGTTTDYTDATDAAIAAGQAKAFSDSETRAALEPLIVSTGDMAMATGQLAIAQDIARFAGVDLATAADAVAKANKGQDKALKTLIPGLELGATATETLGNAAKVTAGQSEAFAKSSAGTSARMADGFAEIGETIGQALLPLLDALLPALLPILQAFGQLIKALLPVLIPLIKLLASYLTTMLGVVLKLVTAFVSFIEKITKAIDKLNFLKGIKLPTLPNFGGQAATTGFVQSATSTRAVGGATGGFSGGGVVINITGDPVSIERSVVKALRTYSRRNGGLSLGLEL